MHVYICVYVCVFCVDFRMYVVFMSEDLLLDAVWPPQRGKILRSDWTVHSNL